MSLPQLSRVNSKMATASRGSLIVFEGLDRSGKSTQCAKLCESLIAAGHQVKHMRFPDRTTAIGSSIDAYLRSSTDLEDHVIHLLFSANRWEFATQMQRDLSAGMTLVIDRYSFSGAVYSAAKQNPGLPLEWAWQPEIGLPRPDLVFYLTVDESVAEQRGGFGAERYEKKEMQRRVGHLFQELFVHRLGMGLPELNVVDANQSIESIQADILNIAKRTLERQSGSLEALNFFGALRPSA